MVSSSTKAFITSFLVTALVGGLALSVLVSESHPSKGESNGFSAPRQVRKKMSKKTVRKKKSGSKQQNNVDVPQKEAVDVKIQETNTLSGTEAKVKDVKVQEKQHKTVLSKSQDFSIYENGNEFLFYPRNYLATVDYSQFPKSPALQNVAIEPETISVEKTTPDTPNSVENAAERSHESYFEDEKLFYPRAYIAKLNYDAFPKPIPCQSDKSVEISSSDSGHIKSEECGRTLVTGEVVAESITLESEELESEMVTEKVAEGKEIQEEEFEDKQDLQAASLEKTLLSETFDQGSQVIEEASADVVTNNADCFMGESACENLDQGRKEVTLESQFAVDVPDTKHESDEKGVSLLDLGNLEAVENVSDESCKIGSERLEVVVEEDAEDIPDVSDDTTLSAPSTPERKSNFSNLNAFAAEFVPQEFIPAPIISAGISRRSSMSSMNTNKGKRRSTGNINKSRGGRSNKSVSRRASAPSLPRQPSLGDFFATFDQVVVSNSKAKSPCKYGSSCKYGPNACRFAH